MSHDFSIARLGEATIPSPIPYASEKGTDMANYVGDDERIIFNPALSRSGSEHPVSGQGLLEVAGPRRDIYFSPGHVHAGVITCGGLCPGINDVIRAITRCLWYRYGVRRITGLRFGYPGLLPETAEPTLPLDPDVVDDIHKIGGTVLGSSRGGGVRTAEIVDALERLNLNMLFTIGGDGTQKGALAIAEEIERRNLRITVVGIPKTIDNDFSFIERSFGFETAVAEAAQAVAAAHTEAHSAINGIGLVKVMGRDSGFIAAHTALASHEANFVLIPEVPFSLEGERGLLHLLERRLDARRHAVIIVAEGAGQDLLPDSSESDASGNRKLSDIGIFLKDAISRHFADRGKPFTLKYIDPSYMIRSAVAAPTDSVYCSRLGNNAVHAAMSGRTKMLVGLVNDHFVHIPMAVAVSRRKQVDREGNLWRDVLEATHQPMQIGPA
ncbi:diphosphate--fructose-6-phosphate 1-phosphotransferase [Alkalispirochaeta sphaeroplastigenens]|uniref:ATP-dependent 6-phosphofructokinase n=1 Tax=Alkalispirochaeta sphaeroplastigenens TaxID=1187066 RepID=A0A2S4JHU7_9SPIO|nr:ATP-dependent 6-phosphofructokinase [Alkalispirochaeta sphaeroplastigenens]POQ99106.1 diphosphate--fructose-6-phosphate 1-phosphotransferase [Alkalispirochaeta sphaeroplastigenens]